jgi:hypothetical protein
MTVILNFLLRVLLLAAGLTVAACMLVVFASVYAVWTLRSAWARLTGNRAPARPSRRLRPSDDVTDVQPRPPS